MNPLILDTLDDIDSMQETQTQCPDGGWWPAIPLHDFRHRVQAAIYVLRGEAFVVHLPKSKPS